MKNSLNRTARWSALVVAMGVVGLISAQSQADINWPGGTGDPNKKSKNYKKGGGSGTVPTVTPTTGPDPTPSPTTVPEAEWKDISSRLPEYANLNDVQFVGSEGWITGGNDKIYYTSDDGKAGTFTTLNMPTGSGITSSVFMKSNTDGYAVTYSGRILHGVNNVWTTLYEPGGTLNSVHFPPSSNTGYTCGNNGKIFSFTNTEITDLTVTGLTATLQSIMFPVNNTDGKLCGNSTIRRYLSGSWNNLQIFDSTYFYNSIFFTDNNTGWVVGSLGKIFKTIDGNTWNPQINSSTASLNDVFFLTSQEGWAVGTGILLHTKDGGSTWTQEASTLTAGKELRAVYFTDTNKGYVVGNGTLLIFEFAAGNGITVTTESTGHAIKGTNSQSGGAPVGVLGIASAADGTTSTGVKGISKSNSGTGIWGESPKTGVYGYATAPGGDSWGVYGKSDHGTGVFGSGQAFGVYGTASPPGYGVYSAGNGKVVGNLDVTGDLKVSGTSNISGNVNAGNITWSAVTSYVSLSAAAFRPVLDTQTYNNSGSTLTTTDPGTTQYLAEVQLPHLSTISKLIFYWTDAANTDASASLYKIDLAGGKTRIGMVNSIGGSSGGGGGTSVTGSSTDDTISDPLVDNSRFAYYVWLTLPRDSNGGTIDPHGVVIEYTSTQPY